jgi:hypothetical protein
LAIRIEAWHRLLVALTGHEAKPPIAIDRGGVWDARAQGLLFSLGGGDVRLHD